MKGKRMFWLNLWRCAAADLLYMLCGAPIKELLDADVGRFLKWNTLPWQGKLMRMNYCLLRKKEFRSVYHYRMRHRPVLRWFACLFLPRIETIELGGVGIGPGLLISHNHCVVYPELTGTNFRVGPGAVIGRNGGFPVFGDNVYVAANATVVGNIRIGSNVIIGAGSVVTKDVPDNCVVAGNPAVVIRHIDDDPRLLNEIK